MAGRRCATRETAGEPFGSSSRSPARAQGSRRVSGRQTAPSADIRADWCLLVANACSPSFPDAACQALEAMLPLLDDWPDGYFDLETAREVALAEKRQTVPNLAEIVTVFRARQSREALHRRLPARERVVKLERPKPSAQAVAAVDQVVRGLAGALRTPVASEGS